MQGSLHYTLEYSKSTISCIPGNAGKNSAVLSQNWAKGASHINKTVRLSTDIQKAQDGIDPIYANFSKMCGLDPGQTEFTFAPW